MPMLALLLFAARLFAPAACAADDLCNDLLRADPRLQALAARETAPGPNGTQRTQAPGEVTLFALQPDRALQVGHQNTHAAQPDGGFAMRGNSRFLRIWQRVDGQWRAERTFQYDVKPQPAQHR